jgi:hypothetical protein
MPACYAEFMQPAAQERIAFLPWIGGQLTDILCEHYERMVGHNNCFSPEA